MDEKEPVPLPFTELRDYGNTPIFGPESCHEEPCEKCGWPRIVGEFCEHCFKNGEMGAEIFVGIQNAILDCHGAAVKCGWYHNPKTGEPINRNDGEQMMLMVSEIAEAMEGNRKGLMDDHLPQFTMETVELADALIRIFDYAGKKELRLAEAYAAKRAYNDHRADHRPENRAKSGGKAY